jgi:hypothetical protein
MRSYPHTTKLTVLTGTQAKHAEDLQSIKRGPQQP